MFDIRLAFTCLCCDAERYCQVKQTRASVAGRENLDHLSEFGSGSGRLPHLSARCSSDWLRDVLQRLVPHE